MQPDSPRAVRVNVSMSPALAECIGPIVAAKGFLGFSDYVQAHLRQDAVSLGMERFDLTPRAAPARPPKK